MREPFHSSKYSIAHAKRRIRELEADIELFIKSDPYTRSVEPDTKRGKDIHKIKLIKPMPAPIPGTAFDALNNLRSALDQAGYVTASARGKAGDHAHFPFGDTLQEAERGHKDKGRSREIPWQIFNHMLSYKPYLRPDGNVLLWALNKLCNSNKHEVISPIVIAGTGLNFGEMVSEIETPFGISAVGVTSVSWPSGGGKPIVCVDNEIEVFSITSGESTKYDLTVSLFIGVTKIDIVAGKPLGALLNDFAGIVERIVLGIEAEARRLGIVN
jgi:hypothetical protein